MPRSQRADLLPGTLDLLILKTLSVQSLHGYGIAQHVQRLSADVLQVEEGSLYPALQRMQLKGWIKSRWRRARPAAGPDTG
jgi:DNA-binding PadR family transcriptional regulator